MPAVAAPSAPTVADGGDSPYGSLWASLTEAERAVLSACLDGGDVAAICRALGCLADSVVSAVNEKAVDLTDDIVIESDGTGYRVIEDYKEIFENE